jgi:hypothetical protein
MDGRPDLRGRPTGDRSTDPFGGTEQERAAAYASALAYCGTCELSANHIVHRVWLSTFPNWAADEQIRSVELDDDDLVLRTPRIKTPAGRGRRRSSLDGPGPRSPHKTRLKSLGPTN